MNQAERIVKLFGGPSGLQQALSGIGIRIDRSTIYRWMWPEERGGCNGRIPSHRIDEIRRAGRNAGLHITEKTFWVDD